MRTGGRFRTGRRTDGIDKIGCQCLALLAGHISNIWNAISEPKNLTANSPVIVLPELLEGHRMVASSGGMHQSFIRPIMDKLAGWRVEFFDQGTLYLGLVREQLERAGDHTGPSGSSGGKVQQRGFVLPIRMARGSMSTPMAWRPSIKASTRVVPEPIMGSKTACPGVDKARMNARGSCGGNLAAKAWKL